MYGVIIYVEHTGELELNVTPPGGGTWPTFESAKAAAEDVVKDIINPDYKPTVEIVS